MRTLLKEPLLHFMLLGAAIFAAFNLFGDNSENVNKPDSITVSSGKIENLAELFQRTWQRPPSKQELQGLVQDHIREEVFYREGVAMGLDQNDTIIRRRLRQKLNFIIEDMSTQGDPGDEVLASYLQQHTDKFRLAPQFSFQQIYLSPDQRGAAIQQDTERLLAQLQQDGDATDPATLGDSIMLESAYKNLTPDQISRIFGERFAEQLITLSPGKWQGPVVSGYGLHLVKIDSFIEGRLPELAEVRAEVLREWDNRRRGETTEKFYQELLQRYDVSIEWPQQDTGASAVPSAEAGQ